MRHPTEISSTYSVWCTDNSLSLNVSKTKVVDYRQSQRAGHVPIHINGVEGERVRRYKFLGVHISEDLSWSLNSNTIARTVRQRLKVWHLLWFHVKLLPLQQREHLDRLHHCMARQLLFFWQQSSSECGENSWHKLIALQDIYKTRCTHSAHYLFATLPSGRRLRSIWSQTTRLKNSFYLQAIRLLNCQLSFI